MKPKLRFQDFAKQTSVQIIGSDQQKNIKGGGGPNNIPPGLMSFPSQAQGCPPPLDNAS